MLLAEHYTANMPGRAGSHKQQRMEGRAAGQAEHKTHSFADILQTIVEVCYRQADSPAAMRTLAEEKELARQVVVIAEMAFEAAGEDKAIGA